VGREEGKKREKEKIMRGGEKEENKTKKEEGG